MNNNNNNKVRFGGVEAGGTTFVLSIAEDEPTNIISRYQFDTKHPNITLKECVEYFKKHNIHSLGIASFGPINLDKNSNKYGVITSTPKEKWRDTNILKEFKTLNIPIDINTDVQATALGELYYGNHGDNITSCCYITVGTGVGVGIVSDNHAIYGLSHPEGGHIRVAKYSYDNYKGNCPYHQDCLEGLTNAKSISDRLNCQPSDLKHIDDSNKVWDIIAYYLAQLCCNLTLFISPHVIILGGGVLKRRILFNKVRQMTLKLLNGYVQVDKIMNNIENYIVPSMHNNGDMDNAGTVGALYLASKAYNNYQQQQQREQHSNNDNTHILNDNDNVPTITTTITTNNNNNNNNNNDNNDNNSPIEVENGTSVFEYARQLYNAQITDSKLVIDPLPKRKLRDYLMKYNHIFKEYRITNTHECVVMGTQTKRLCEMCSTKASQPNKDESKSEQDICWSVLYGCKKCGVWLHRKSCFNLWHSADDLCQAHREIRQERLKLKRDGKLTNRSKRTPPSSPQAPNTARKMHKMPKLM